MIEMMLGAMILALWVKVGAETAGDLVTTLRASKAGEWSLIDKQRDRKAAKSQGRREAVSKAWQATRAARNKKAGGTGQYRPGMAAYLGDVYHGVWEDQLEKRKAKRTSRPRVGPDGKRPAPSKMDQAVEAKVDAQRTKTGYMGRAKQVGRMLWEPVGENRTPTNQPARQHVSEPEPEWLTPDADEDDTPTSVVHDDHHPYCVTPCGPKCTARPVVSYKNAGKWAWSCRRPGCDGKAFDYDTEALAQAAAAKHRCGNGNPPGEGVQVLGRVQAATPSVKKSEPQYDELTLAALDALAEADPDGLRRIRNMDDAYEAVCRAFPNADPEAVGDAIAVADKAAVCNVCGQRRGAKPPCVHRQAAANRLREARARMNTPPKTSNTTDPSTTSNGGTDMSTIVHAQEISTNEDARQAFAALATAAAEAADAVNILEAAKAKMAAIANGTSDGMTAKAFDATATAAAAEAADAINVGTLADWSEKIDSVTAVAERGVRSLDKYLDSENIVVENKIDPTTLAATSS